jgi:hypothetical protein
MLQAILGTIANTGQRGSASGGEQKDLEDGGGDPDDQFHSGKLGFWEVPPPPRSIRIIGLGENSSLI